MLLKRAPPTELPVITYHVTVDAPAVRRGACSAQYVHSDESRLPLAERRAA